jgi:glutaredoxin
MENLVVLERLKHIKNYLEKIKSKIKDYLERTNVPNVIINNTMMIKQII